MQNLTQVTFSDSSRNSDLETGDIPFRCAYVATPEGTVRPSRIDTASGSTKFRRTETPLLAEAMGYVHANPEDAIIADLDCVGYDDNGDEIEEEDLYVRPESYVRRKRAAGVRMVSINENGRKVLSPDQRPVVAEPVQEAPASEPEPNEAAEASSKNLRVLTHGERRTLFLVRRSHDGQPRMKKVDIRPPRFRSQAKPGAPRMCANEGCHTEFLPPKNAPNAHLCPDCHRKEMRKTPSRTCKCGATFRLFPSMPTDAALCPTCHKQEREAAKRHKAAKHALIESAQAERQKKVALIIKQAVLHGGSLPEGAEIKKDEGRQVIVLFHGKSYTVYRMRYGKTERKRQARRSRYGHAA